MGSNVYRISRPLYIIHSPSYRYNRFEDSYLLLTSFRHSRNIKDINSMEQTVPTIEQLNIVIKEKYKNPDTDLISRAYEFAKLAHRGQYRLGGLPYITHPIATAIQLANMRIDLNVVAAGLLHDVPEDTPFTLDNVREVFGEDISGMVEGVTKLGKIQYRGVDRYIENLRKMFFAMAKDVRTIFIKFADRLHNLQTLDSVPEQKRLRIAREVMEIYAPVANRLGMGEFKGEFEDLSFKYLMPKEYEYIKELEREKITQTGEMLDEMTSLVKNELEKNNIKPIAIHGRLKRLYSLYKKLQRHENDINKIYDIVALRIIVNDINECYSVLGIVHQIWKPMVGRIKDYIAQPKLNGYRSLHTTVFTKGGHPIEIQIRTLEMNEEASFGIAGHWRYKDLLGENVQQKRNIRWLQEIGAIQKEIKTREDFIEHLDELKFDTLRDRIFVFTPNGDVIDLPEGSTPIDFAYAIHTEIGNKCSAARINDVMINLNTELKSGDVCEIIIDKKRKSPNSDWLDFVKTNHARAKIRDATKVNVRGWLKTIVHNRKNK